MSSSTARSASGLAQTHGDWSESGPAAPLGGVAMLFHLGYVSTESRRMESQELVDLLDQALKRNKVKDITGLLLHREDSFFQVIEGEEAEVQQIFSSIRRDPRHHNVNVLFEGPIEAREFPDWQMGFVELDGVDVDRLPGFSDFLYSESPPRRLFEELSQAKRLMLLFRAMQ
jgi:hypothetical protein